MRDFATFLPRFWTTGPGMKFRGDQAAQVVASYLFTAPASNHIGIYYLPIGTIAHDCGISEEGASKALRRAIEGAFCSYDGASEHVFVHEAAQVQILERAERLKPADKRVAGVKKELLKYRESVHFLPFVEMYRGAFHLIEPEFQQAPSKPLARGILKETETETETNTDHETSRIRAREAQSGDEKSKEEKVTLEEFNASSPTFAPGAVQGPRDQQNGLSIQRQFKERFEAAVGAMWQSGSRYYTEFMEIERFCQSQAGMDGCSKAHVIETLLDNYFADDYARQRTYTPSLLVKNPAQYYKPPADPDAEVDEKVELTRELKGENDRLAFLDANGGEPGEIQKSKDRITRLTAMLKSIDEERAQG